MKTISSVFFLDLSVKISHVKYCGESVDRYLMYCIVHMLSQCCYELSTRRSLISLLWSKPWSLRSINWQQCIRNKLIYLYKYKCNNSRNYCQYLMFTVIAVYVVQMHCQVAGCFQKLTQKRSTRAALCVIATIASSTSLAFTKPWATFWLSRRSSAGWTCPSTN